MMAPIRMLNEILRFCSARSFQIQANVEIFNAFVHKLMYRFVERCGQSENSLVTALTHSARHFRSKYYAHYRDILILDNG